MTATVTKGPAQNIAEARDDLPEGWTAASLYDGLAADVQPGFACGVNNREGQGIAHLRPMNVNEGGHIVLSDIKFVPADMANREARLLRRGDVLFNNTNSPELVGKTAYYGLPEPRAFSNHMTRLRCHAEIIDSRFCALALHQRWREGYFREVCNNHVSQASVGRAVLLGAPILLPPLPEQKRIVAKVEALLASVNSTRERLARVPAILKRFRQSVLAAACSGRLTEDWRASHARSGDSGKLEEVGELPSGWLQVAARELYLDARYGTSVKCEREPRGVPVLRVPNIAAGRLDLSDLKYGPLSARELESLSLAEGDLVICRTNGSLDLVGKAAVIPALARPHAFASYLIRLRANRERLLPGFLHAVLTSRIGRDHIEKRARTTAGQFNLNLGILSSLWIPLPPVTEQEEILCRIEALLKLADAIEQRVSAASARAEKLTQAILAKAFRGELVPTEAELARREGRSYEPASTLLSRARVEGNQRAPKSRGELEGPATAEAE